MFFSFQLYPNGPYIKDKFEINFFFNKYFDPYRVLFQTKSDPYRVLFWTELDRVKKKKIIKGHACSRVQATKQIPPSLTWVRRPKQRTCVFLGLTAFVDLYFTKFFYIFNL